MLPPPKKHRKEEDQLQLPFLPAALSGDSVQTIGFDFSYGSLQGLNNLVNVTSVQYEWVGFLSRTQGLTISVWGMMAGTAITSPVVVWPVAMVVSSFSFRLENNWSIGVQTKTATITPGPAANESRLVYDLKAVLTADNVSSVDGNIVRGLIRTGVVQDFTNDIIGKLDSTTVLPKNKLQGIATKTAEINAKIMTRENSIKLAFLTDVFETMPPWTPTQTPVVFAANWAKGLLSLATQTGIFAQAPIVYAQTNYSVPYGVIPHIHVGNSTEVYILLLRYNTTQGAHLVIAAQPMETFGLAPAIEGTWVASIILCSAPYYGPTTISPQSSLAKVPGQIRMFCPTSVTTVVYTGLYQNIIYLYGSALGLAPPANAVPESYGFRPPPLSSSEDLWNDLDSATTQTAGKWNPVNLV